MRNLFINRNDYIHNRSYKGNLREYLNSCEGEEKILTLRSFMNIENVLVKKH